ncbi:MAG: N-acetyl-gamma-glutamyl-phosphate reductase [Pseudothermotoga sp.]
MTRIRAGIVGATGYTGMELLRILKNHPNVQITYVSSKSFSGKSINEVHPFTLQDKVLEDVNAKKIAVDCDVLFTALPSGASYELVKELSSMKVVDLGADLRFDDVSIYERWYVKKLAGYDRTKRAYGLPELYRNEIRQVNLVGNPGCYPTCVLLSVAPLLKEGLLSDKNIFVDAKSGVSGAGKKEELEYSFCEINENLKAYNPVIHRHVPEMEEQMKKLFGDEVTVTFVPHLVPMTRGILSTIYLKSDLNVDEVYKLYCDFYEAERFIHVLKPGIYPSTKWSYGSNHMYISFAKDERNNTLIIIGVLDNLVKGASGQAVQNMNLLFSIPENTGLESNPFYP